MSERKIQKLSEGYDFIEENTAFCNEPLSYQDINETIILESEGGKTSPFKILGKVSGVFAPIKEFSRNRRLYSESLWPTILANEAFQSRLKGRRIFSCLGHEDKRIDDLDLKEGKVSGIISCLEVREDTNNKPFLYGELDILDTPAGRILKAMHEGGAGLYVSSRGAGKLVPVPGKDYSIVLPENYYCHCFDTVLEPGFLQAKPVFEDATSETPSVSESHESPSFTDAQLHKKAQETKAQQKAPEAKATLKDFVANKEQTNPIKDESSARFFTKQELKKETNEELETIKSQIQQLAGIVEKVVDSIYEKDEVPVQEENSDVKKSAILATLGLLSEANLSEEALIEIVEEIKKGIN